MRNFQVSVTIMCNVIIKFRFHYIYQTLCEYLSFVIDKLSVLWYNIFVMLMIGSGTLGKRQKNIFLTVWIILIIILVTLICVIGIPAEHDESIQEVMKDGVLHELNHVEFFGIKVNPGFISAVIVSLVLIAVAVIIRIFAFPRFREIPGKFQNLVELLVEFFDNMARANSPHKTGFVGGYIFSAGVFIFFGTLFELFGVQALTTTGKSVALPAPLSDINGAIGMGFLSYLIILGCGIMTGGLKGALGVLKDFSLPISMSFRLFGALLSGLLVTELVYYYTLTSFILPVIVGVLFTLLHAVIQTYVLATLVSVFYGEASEPKKSNKKKD